MGFYELECQFANRVANAPKLILDPTRVSTYAGKTDGDQDCDGDGLTNRQEAENNLDPLDGSDAGRDEDGDGLTNLMEYALGTPPEAAGGSPDYLPYVEDNQNGSTQYVYRRQMAATDLSYVVEISQDLINWNHNADNTGQTYTEEVGEAVFNGDGTETVRVIPVGLEDLDKVFFRLSVTLTSD